jgi:hypothetical protein
MDVVNQKLDKRLCFPVPPHLEEVMGQLPQYLLRKYTYALITRIRRSLRVILCKKAQNSKCVTKKCVIFLTSTS